MIRLDDIHVTFGKDTALEKKVLRGLGLALSRHEFVTIIGSNGAGKSTLLNVISGSVRPEHGRVEIDGQQVDHWPIWKRSGLIAQVGQDPRIGSYEDMTIAENMAVAACRGRRRGLRCALTASERDTFAEALKVLGIGLEDRMDMLVGQLSGGQRQALALVMTTLRPITVLLLDEHTSALDPKMAETVLRLTDTVIAAHGLTVMMVTHSMQQALSHGSRTLMLHGGKMLFDVSGDERKSLSVTDLLARFKASSHGDINEDRLLLD
ncbi:MAG: ABC transporter ATP-binding protein [Rhizobiaceae bacterium]